MIAAASQPAPANTVQGGVFIDPQRPGVTVLRFQSGLATFDLLLDTPNVVDFLRNVLQAAETEVAKSGAAGNPLLRPVPGLLLPKVADLPDSPIPPAMGNGAR